MIVSEEQTKAAFLADLRALLAKYGAEMEAEDHYSGYPECGEDIRITVTIPSVYNEDYECEREWTEIDLGRFIYPEKEHE